MIDKTLKTLDSENDGALSDEDLDNISGGVVPVAVGIGMTVAGVGMMAGALFWPGDDHDIITDEVRNAGKTEDAD